MLLVPVPWALPRAWALPFLSILAPSERYAAQRGKHHKRDNRLGASGSAPGEALVG